MPTIFTSAGFRFSFFPNDHTPVHVHVEKGGATLIIEWKDGRMTIRKNQGMKQGDARRAFRLAGERADEIHRLWSEFYGG